MVAKADFSQQSTQSPRRVLHSSFVTPAQLYEFMKLDYCAWSRNAFDDRLRRLLAHDLLVRHEIPNMNCGVVYSISRAGASELVGRGEITPAPRTSAKSPMVMCNTLWN